MLTWWEGKTEHGLGDGDHVIFDAVLPRDRALPGRRTALGRPARVHPHPAGHGARRRLGHPRRVDLPGRPRRGSRSSRAIVQELEIPSAARALRVAQPRPRGARPRPTPGSARLFDYFHINSIDVDADGDLLVSARNTWAVYKIARRDGRVVWRLGGKKSDFALGRGTPASPGSTMPATTATAARSPSSTTAPRRRSSRSRGRSRSRSTCSGSARRSCSAYTHSPPLSAHIFGSVQTQPNGNVFVGWGAEPVLHRVRPRRPRCATTRRCRAAARATGRSASRGSGRPPSRRRCRDGRPALRELERHHGDGRLAAAHRQEARLGAVAGLDGSEAAVRDRADAARHRRVRRGHRARREREAARDLAGRRSVVRDSGPPARMHPVPAAALETSATRGPSWPSARTAERPWCARAGGRPRRPTRASPRS